MYYCCPVTGQMHAITVQPFIDADDNMQHSKQHLTRRYNAIKIDSLPAGLLVIGVMMIPAPEDRQSGAEETELRKT